MYNQVVEAAQEAVPKTEEFDIRWEWVSKDEAIQMAEDAKLDVVMFSYFWWEGKIQL